MIHQQLKLQKVTSKAALQVNNAPGESHGARFAPQSQGRNSLHCEPHNYSKECTSPVVGVHRLAQHGSQVRLRERLRCKQEQTKVNPILTGWKRNRITAGTGGAPPL